MIKCDTGKKLPVPPACQTAELFYGHDDYEIVVHENLECAAFFDQQACELQFSGSSSDGERNGFFILYHYFLDCHALNLIYMATRGQPC
jgi:hypothetical protein